MLLGGNKAKTGDTYEPHVLKDNRLMHCMCHWRIPLEGVC